MTHSIRTLSFGAALMALGILASRAETVDGAIPTTAQPGTLAAPRTHVWTLDWPFDPEGLKVEIQGKPKSRNVEGLGNVVEFDGKAAALVVFGNPLEGMNRFTVEVCVKPADDGPMQQRFFHVQDASGQRLLLETRMDAAGHWSLDTHMFVTRENQRTLHDPAKIHDSNKWHWVALVYDGKTMSHYVDGVKELEGPVDFGAMGKGDTSLGMRLTQRSWFKGALREVRVTPEALPVEKLQSLRRE